MIKKLTKGLLASAALLLGFQQAQAQESVFALSAGNVINTFSTATPGAIFATKTITGVTPTRPIVALDYRPATGELYGFGFNTADSTYQLYVVDFNEGTATLRGNSGKLPLNGNIGFDFNPTVDRIRVVGANGVNYRLHPVTGGIAGTDGTLAYVSGDANAGKVPAVGSVTYVNNFNGTSMIDIDEANGVVALQNPPNNGVLNTIGNLGLSLGTDKSIDFDQGFGSSTFYISANTAAAANLPGTRFDTLYSAVIVPTGTPSVTLTKIGQIGNGVVVLDIAVAGGVKAKNPSIPAYGLTGGNVSPNVVNNNLAFFDANAPTLFSKVQAIGGIAAGYTALAIDARPRTKELYLLAYRATDSTAKLYKVDVATLAATQVGTDSLKVNLGTGADVAFDFNPTVDRIRLIGSTTGTNYRLHPDLGTVVATDAVVAYNTGDANAANTPRVSSILYTNSYIASTKTSLYYFDAANATLGISGADPNAGKITTIGATGLVTNAADLSIDGDIYFNGTSNVMYLNANSNVNDTLYTVNVATGAVTKVGNIGGGASAALRDIAIGIANQTPSANLAQAQFFTLSTNNRLQKINRDLTVDRDLPVTGVKTGQTLVGMDFRPLDGKLYALGYNNTVDSATIYTLDTLTGVATIFSDTLRTLKFGGATGKPVNISFDFNPAADRLRIVGFTADSTQNFRLNLNAPLAVFRDTKLAYASGDTNAGQLAIIGAVAYTNSYNSATGGGTTAMFDIDETKNILVKQTSPNGGVLATKGSLGITLDASDFTNDLDIYSTDLANGNIFYLSANVSGGNNFDNLYTIDTTGGAATLVGRIGQGFGVRDIAFPTRFRTATIDLSKENLSATFSPNPTNGLVNIQFNNVSGSDVNVNIYDIRGALVRSQIFRGIAGEFNQAVDLSSQDTGVYFIRVETDRKATTQRVSKF